MAVNVRIFTCETRDVRILWGLTTTQQSPFKRVLLKRVDPYLFSPNLNRSWRSSDRPERNFSSPRRSHTVLARGDSRSSLTRGTSPQKKSHSPAPPNCPLRDVASRIFSNSQLIPHSVAFLPDPSHPSFLVPHRQTHRNILFTACLDRRL
jgi:hypothetical protein